MSISTPQQHRASTTFLWATRCIPAFSVCIVVTVLVFAFIVRPFGRHDTSRHHGKATTWQLVLSAYTVLLHIMSIIFPTRVCWALGDIMQRMKVVAMIRDNPQKRKTQTIKTEEGSVTYPVPLFVIILPAYKEEMSTLEETLRVLGSHPQAHHSYHVCTYNVILVSHLPYSCC